MTLTSQSFSSQGMLYLGQGDNCMGNGRSGWGVIFGIIAGGLFVGGIRNILWFILLTWQMRTFVPEL